MATSPSIAGTSSISTLLRRNSILRLAAARVERVELNHSLSTCRAIRSSAVARASTGELVVVGDGVVEKGRDKGRILKVGLICGGPSAERGISLNSARSVLDHLQGDDLQVSCYYIDCNLNAHAISSAQIRALTQTHFFKVVGDIEE